MTLVRELVGFVVKQLQSLVFPVAMLALLFVTAWLPLGPVPRYDALLIGAIVIQWLMVRSGLETIDELKVITLFHIAGLLLEGFKTAVGSWAYPDDAYTKIATVPLYAGFMYASVASYMMQAWRRFDLQLTRFPRPLVTVPLVIAIYVNFFTHHVTYDMRWWLMAAVFLVFGRSWVHFTPARLRLRMPVVLSFLLIGLGIWIAENMASFVGAYQYPNQAGDWQLVHPGKIGSWFILCVMSFVMVAEGKHLKAKLTRRIFQRTARG